MHDAHSRDPEAASHCDAQLNRRRQLQSASLSAVSTMSLSAKLSTREVTTRCVWDLTLH